MGKLSEGKDDHFVILLWGPPKSGKTVLASQFPNPFFIDLDNGLGSIRALMRRDGISADFDVIDIKPTPTTDEDFEKLCGKVHTKAHPFLKTKKLFEVACRTLDESRTVILDNVSRLSEHLIDWIETSSGRPQMQIQDWGTFVSEFQDFCYIANAAKANVILIGHEEYKENKATEEILKTLYIPTKMRHRIPSIATDFVYMTTKVQGASANRKVVRFLQTTPDRMTALGSRSLIPDMEDPTYAKMKPFIEASLGKTLGEPCWTPKTT